MLGIEIFIKLAMKKINKYVQNPADEEPWKAAVWNPVI